MKAMTKAQLARAAGVNNRTFRRWLATPEIQHKLSQLHLNKKQQILPPPAVQIIKDHYAIEID